MNIYEFDTKTQNEFYSKFKINNEKIKNILNTHPHFFNYTITNFNDRQSFNIDDFKTNFQGWLTDNFPLNHRGNDQEYKRYKTNYLTMKTFFIDMIKLYHFEKFINKKIRILSRKSTDNINYQSITSSISTLEKEDLENKLDDVVVEFNDLERVFLREFPMKDQNSFFNEMFNEKNVVLNTNMDFNCSDMDESLLDNFYLPYTTQINMNQYDIKINSSNTLELDYAKIREEEDKNIIRKTNEFDNQMFIDEVSSKYNIHKSPIDKYFDISLNQIGSLFPANNYNIPIRPLQLVYDDNIQINNDIKQVNNENSAELNQLLNNYFDNINSK